MTGFIQFHHTATRYTTPLGRDPQIGTLFKPEPPFERYNRGFVYRDPQDHHYAVMLYTPNVENDGNPTIRRTLSLETYHCAVDIIGRIRQLSPEDQQMIAHNLQMDGKPLSVIAGLFDMIEAQRRMAFEDEILAQHQLQLMRQKR